MEKKNKKISGEQFESSHVRENPELVGMFEQRLYLNPYYMYFMTNKYFPDKHRFEEIDHTNFYRKMLQQYEIDMEKTIISRNYDFNKKKNNLRTCVLPLNKKTWIYFNPGYDGPPCVEILYHKSEHTELVDKIANTIKKFRRNESTLNKIFLLKMQDYGGYGITPFTLVPQKMNIERNYNDDFLPVHNIIKSRLSRQDDKGLVLLHGTPGTGKLLISAISPVR